MGNRVAFAEFGGNDDGAEMQMAEMEKLDGRFLYSDRLITDNQSRQWTMHCYRAEMNRLVGYRLRLDTSTQWAVTTMTTVLLFVLNKDTLTPNACIVAALFLLLFCSLEARRYLFYEAIRKRTGLFERGFFVESALRAAKAQLVEGAKDAQIPFDPEAFEALKKNIIGEKGLQRKPSLDEFARLITRLYASHIYPPLKYPSFWEAFHLRFSRVYIYLIWFVYLTWIVKLQTVHMLHHSFDVIIVWSVILLIVTIVTLVITPVNFARIQGDTVGA